MDSDSAAIAMGIVSIAVGLVLAYWMLAFPEGINPAYPLATALLAPLVFVSGGLLACAAVSGRRMLVDIAFGSLALGLLALVHWGAFSSGAIECRETVSLFGIALLERYPSEAECRSSLRRLLEGFDVVVSIALAAIAWRKAARRRRGP